MNARRVHELMRLRFPEVRHADRDWSLVQSERGVDREQLSKLLAENIHSEHVIVEVHRKLGAALPVHDAVSFIGSHIGKGEIRVANPEFTGFVVVAVNGVATGWQHAG